VGHVENVVINEGDGR